MFQVYLVCFLYTLYKLCLLIWNQFLWLRNQNSNKYCRCHCKVEGCYRAQIFCIFLVSTDLFSVIFFSVFCFQSFCPHYAKSLFSPATRMTFWLCNLPGGLWLHVPVSCHLLSQQVSSFFDLRMDYLFSVHVFHNCTFIS